MTSADHPRVIAPPPLLYLGALVLAGLLQWAWPVALVPPDVGLWLGTAALIAGLAVDFWGAYQMLRARTAIDPYRAPSAIVDSGPFAFTRNPLYVGLDLVFAGLVLLLNSLWGLVLLALLLPLMHYGVILREERYLEDRFGDAYREYRGRVRRYL